MEKQKKQSHLKTFIYGASLGATLLAPGLSVATLALVLGIYEKLLGSISDFFSSKWKSTLPFLIPFGFGAFIAVIATSRLFSWAIDHYPHQLAFLFLGFIIGAIPLLLKTSKAKENFKTRHIIPLIVVATLVACMTFLHPTQDAYAITQLDAATVIRLLIAGALAATAMLLPGLSAALILLLVGAYATLTQAISDFNLPVVGITLIGMLIGLIISSKGIKHLLEHYTTLTYAISIGMVIGSVVVVFPGLPETALGILKSVLTFAVGLVAVMLIERRNLAQ